jgi:hypothetical protein
MERVMWERLKRFHRYSETVALAHALGWLGLFMEAIAQFPDVASTVGLASIVPPAYLGKYTIVIAGLTLFARLRRFSEPDHKDNDHA